MYVRATGHSHVWVDRYQGLVSMQSLESFPSYPPNLTRPHLCPWASLGTNNTGLHREPGYVCTLHADEISRRHGRLESPYLSPPSARRRHGDSRRSQRMTHPLARKPPVCQRRPQNTVRDRVADELSPSPY
jgi:hypothetical protein